MDDHKIETLSKLVKAIKRLKSIEGEGRLKNMGYIKVIDLWDTTWGTEAKETPAEKKNRLAKEKKKKEYQKEYQKKYRARKKLEKQCKELMEEVNRLNEEYRNTYNRFDIMDIG